MSTLPAAYWHALNIILDVNPWKLLAISQRIGGVEGFFRLNENQLISAGLDIASSTKIISKRKSVDPAKAWEKITKTGIKVLTFDNASYPKQLTEIPSAPPIIYVRGNMEVLRQSSLAVVGSRKISSYGKQAVAALVPPMVQADLAIVSGMAFGVDTAALECCLENDGTPIAVLASSLDYHEIVPRTQIELAKRIEQRGCLVSENPPGRIIQKLHFPLRNRLVSGLSLGTIVIEGERSSGSLITANAALEQNREVFAVPGSIFSQNSSGTNNLIKRGAKCVTEFKDIALEFGWDLKATKSLKEVSLSKPLEKKLYQHLSRSSASLSELIALSKSSISEVLAALTELELAGVLKQSKDGNYAKIK